MSDYSAKVYMKEGGDELVVAAGGKITVQEGGEVAGVDLASIPTSDPEDGVTIWNDGGVLKVASSG